MDAAPPQQVGQFQSGPSVGLTESWDAQEIRKENKMKSNWRNVMTKLYAVAALASALMGATLNAAAAGPAATSLQDTGLVHGAVAHGAGLGGGSKIPHDDRRAVAGGERAA